MLCEWSGVLKIFYSCGVLGVAFFPFGDQMCVCGDQMCVCGDQMCVCGNQGGGGVSCELSYAQSFEGESCVFCFDVMLWMIAFFLSTCCFQNMFRRQRR